MPEPTSTQGLDQTLAAAARGDDGAWRVLVQLYSTRVYALLVRQCGDRELSQEITQAAFVKVVTKIGEYTEQGKFEAWLFRIAMNSLRDEMRRRKRQARTMDMSGGSDSDTGEGAAWAAAEHSVTDRQGHSAGDEEDSPLDQVSRAEQIERLKRAIKQLSPADQEILNLRHTAGLSFAQIAETLEQPLGTVLARGHRALAKLRKLMEEDDDEPGGNPT